MMKLWHIMPKEVYDKTIGINKPYICDIFKSKYISDIKYDNEKFQDAYFWMTNQLNKKIDNPNNIEYPVWAWYKYKGRKQFPNPFDNYFKGFFDSDELIVLELEIDNNQIILSDIHKWNDFCLNNKPDLKTSEDYENYRNAPNEETRLNIIHKSWHNIFDISKSKYIQACFWKLKPENVVRVYQCRNCAHPERR